MAIYCAQCGKESQPEARFCSICGQSLGVSAAPFRPVAAFGALRRLRTGRKVAGVCQGLANHYGWDVSMVRVVMLLLAIAAFPVGFILYGLLWVVVPEEPLLLPAATGPGSSSFANQS